MMQQEAHIQVIAKNLYQDQNREPIPFGVLDRKMVISISPLLLLSFYNPSTILIPGSQPEEREL